jgi:long-subunit acyl-CoA synthetase (AMP-forming)
MKFVGIFSENRMQWFMTELACCSDSICIVPIAVENQYMNEDRISSIINQTEMTTVCVSKLTIGVVLDLKSQNRIPKLKNLILYDLAEDLHITLAS